MSPRINILLTTAVVLLAGVGIVALMAIPCEGVELSRWFLLMLVSKAVGIGCMTLAIYILKLYLHGVGCGVVPPLTLLRHPIRRLRSLRSLNHRIPLWSGFTTLLRAANETPQRPAECRQRTGRVPQRTAECLRGPQSAARGLAECLRGLAECHRGPQSASEDWQSATEDRRVPQRTAECRQRTGRVPDRVLHRRNRRFTERSGVTVGSRSARPSRVPSGTQQAKAIVQAESNGEACFHTAEAPPIVTEGNRRFVTVDPYVSRAKNGGNNVKKQRK